MARRVAEALGFAYLDTGAMYRAATWWALDRGIDLDDPDAVAESTEQMPLDMHEVNGRLEVYVEGRDVTAAIRTPEVTREIHRLDQNPRVRAHLVEQQRRFGAQGPAVAEGRDIGTVVFPKAKCKVFLTASLDERTRRRAEQLKASGIPVAFQQLMSEIAERDRSNTERKESPLRQAEDAIVVDTTALTPEETVQHIVDLARERL
ncbi:MAG: CMP/dCMP kinase [Candidatus Hydrogenedentes bacterium]|nr:CMP/dCMP kinase [Candidatus Hydrogenedentota bacterium]